jgi:uncharacterized protein (DUF1684 family)
MASSCGDNQHTSEILEWRKERIAELTAPVGWASLAGLYWLSEGTTSLGMGEDYDVPFSGEGNKLIASIKVVQDEVFLKNHSSEELTVNGEVVDSIQMMTDQDSVNSVVRFQQFEWVIIERDGKKGLRLWDTTHVNRSKYKVLDYFPVSEEFRVKATFDPFDPPNVKVLKNVLGMDIPLTVPGLLSFNLSGKEYTLEALDGGSEDYFLIFADETTGGDTYGGGRYLYCKKADQDNMTWIDFNKAYTPPCGFTEYATCLLPTRENTLSVEILAGEKYLFDH